MVPLQDPLEESDLVTIAELGLHLVSRPLGEIMSHAESLARAKRWALAWVQGGSQALEGAVSGDADLCEFLHPVPVLLGATHHFSAGRWPEWSSQALQRPGVCIAWSCTLSIFVGDVSGPHAERCMAAARRCRGFLATAWICVRTHGPYLRLCWSTGGWPSVCCSEPDVERCFGYGPRQYGE